MLRFSQDITLGTLNLRVGKTPPRLRLPHAANQAGGDVLFILLLPLFLPLPGNGNGAQLDLVPVDPSSHTCHQPLLFPPSSSHLTSINTTHKLSPLLTFAHTLPFLSCPPCSDGT